MKISYIDDDSILIYLNKNIIKNCDFKDTSDIKDYFREIFINVNKKLDMDIRGFYLTKIYKDDNYGAVIEMIKEELEYYDYYMDEIDMHIMIEESNFLYKIKDIFVENKLLDYFNILIYNKNYYLEQIKPLNDILKGYLLEISELIYKDTNNILKYGKKIVF